MADDLSLSLESSNHPQELVVEFCENTSICVLCCLTILVYNLVYEDRHQFMRGIYLPLTMGPLVRLASWHRARRVFIHILKYSSCYPSFCTVLRRYGGGHHLRMITTYGQ